MSNKAVSFPIMLLVITTLVLTIFSLAYFIQKQNQDLNSISVSNEMDKLYLQQIKLDFYLQDIFDKTTNDFDLSLGETEFRTLFRSEMEKYKDKNNNYPIRELALVDLNLEKNMNVQITSNEIILDLLMVIDNGVAPNDIKITYTYNKKFRKIFK